MNFEPYDPADTVRFLGWCLLALLCLLGSAWLEYQYDVSVVADGIAKAEERKTK